MRYFETLVALRDNTTCGNPTGGGPLVGFLFEIPHFPSGYQVGLTSNLPTRNFTEWVNELTFLLQKCTMMSKNCVFLLIRFTIGLDDVRVAECY